MAKAPRATNGHNRLALWTGNLRQAIARLSRSRPLTLTLVLIVAVTSVGCDPSRFAQASADVLCALMIPFCISLNKDRESIGTMPEFVCECKHEEGDVVSRHPECRIDP